MRPVLATVLAVFLALAGCLSGGDEPVDAAAAGDALADAAAPTPVANATAVADEPQPATVALSYSGNTGTGACVFVVGACEFAQPGSEDFHVFDAVAGTPVHLVATFTYPEQKPGMSFYVGFCSGATAEEVSCDDYQTGASPFVREFDLTSYATGTLFGFSVGSLNPATEPAGAMVFADSTFEMTGELHLLR